MNPRSKSKPKDRFGNKYYIRHKDTKLCWLGQPMDMPSGIVDYSKIYGNTNLTYTLWGTSADSYMFSTAVNKDKLYYNLTSLFHVIATHFIHPIEYKNQTDLYFNGLVLFLKNFEIVNIKTNRTINNKAFLKNILRFYLKEKMNRYCFSIAGENASVAANKILDDNLLKIKYCLIYDNKHIAKENYHNFIKFDDTIAEKMELHKSGIFFQDKDVFTVYKLLSSNHKYMLDLNLIHRILNSNQTDFEKEFQISLHSI